MLHLTKGCRIRRPEESGRKARDASRDYPDIPDADRTKSGNVRTTIARQRPGTAKGFIFISMEDETGIANVILTPDLYEQDRLVMTRSRFLLVEGPLQNQENVIHVKATRLTALSDRALEVQAHDFH